MAADSSTSAQRRRATKPLIEKRRRARINSSLAQLREIVAKPHKTQETRSNRLEKADILEMTVDYVKRLHEKSTVIDDSEKEVATTTDFEQSFKDGYKLCMSEVQKFFFKNHPKQASKDVLGRSLQNYLLQVYRESLRKEKKLQQSGTYNEFNASSLNHESYKLNSDLRSSKNTTKDNYDFHSENSNLGYSNSFPSTDDDEMTETYSKAEFKNNSDVIESYLLNNDMLQMRNVSYNSNQAVDTAAHVWRPW